MGRLLIVGISIFAVLTHTASAMLHILNPQNDGIAEGTDISTYYPHIALSALGVSSTSVYSTASSFSGDQVFGYDDGFGPDPSWSFATGLRGDFNAPINWVSVTYESDANVILEIYDASNNFLDSTSLFGSGTLSLTNASTAYFIARIPFMGNDQSDILEIRFEVVPEPSTMALFGAGLAAVAVRARRRNR